MKILPIYHSTLVIYAVSIILTLFIKSVTVSVPAWRLNLTWNQIHLKKAKQLKTIFYAGCFFPSFSSKILSGSI